MPRILKISNTRAAQGISLLIADMIFFGATDATKVAPYAVIIGFILLTLTCYWAVRGLLALSRLYGLNIKRSRSLSYYLTAVISGLLALQSIGDLGGFDLIVLLPLITVGYIYMTYAKADKANL